MSRPEKRENGQLRAVRATIGYGRMPVVADLDLAIPPGSFTALVGPNGSGKSTILRTLARLMRPARGEIMLDDMPLQTLPAKVFARRIGLLAQSPRAPEGLTVRELVQQGRYPHRTIFGGWTKADEDACTEALRLTAMEDFAERGLDNLSGGQRQRAWISMVLAQETPILLLDEPTTFLDLSHQIEIMELLRSLVATRCKTVVAVLHDLNQAARYASHMVMLDAGKVVAAGTPGQVITTDNIAGVFGIAASVTPDPFTGTPMYIPLATQTSLQIRMPEA